MNILIHKLSPKIGILERNSSGTECTSNSHFYTPFFQLECHLRSNPSDLNTVLELSAPPVFRFTPPFVI